MVRLNIQNQGHVNSGWRYSSKKGQESLLETLVLKLPQWVSENKPMAVWWKVFTPEAEQLFLADVDKVMIGGNFEIKTGGSPISESDELTEDLDVVKGGLSSNVAIDHIASITGCSVKRCEVLGANEEYTLIKTPPIQGYDYIPSKVYKVSLYDLSYTEVWDCGQTKLGRLLKEKLIKEELV